MADIAAVLKKTIDGLPRHDAGIRAKVYDKARSQIQAKLLAAKPDADQAMIDRNMAVVERAIRAVEDDYRFQDELGDVLGAERAESGLFPPDEDDGDVADTPPPAAPDEADVAEPAPEPDPAPEDHAGRNDPPADDPVFSEMIAERSEPAMPPPPAAAPELADSAPELRPDPFETEAPRADEPTSPLDEVTADTSDSISVAPLRDGADHDASLTDAGEEEAEPSRPEELSRAGYRPEPKHDRTRRWDLIAVVLIVLLLAGGISAVAYFLPDFARTQIAALEDGFDNLFGDGDGSADGVTGDEPASPSDASPADPAGSEPSETRPEKFTQRLAADGSESDAGPGGEPIDEFGEGTSVAPLTVARSDSETTETPTTDSEVSETPSSEQSPEPAVQVGQRAIYSEERTVNEELRRLQGSVVWTKVQEQPGPEMEEEPALRADLYIPDTGTSLRMTLRRNGDRSLPASHVIEVIFEPTTKEPGRGIREILRMMFKESEAVPGNPLNAFPAEIGSNFFLVMLDDSQQARQTNLDLIRNRDWIDLLVILEAGRRALFTMEKGLPGTEVVNEVLDYWQNNPLPQS